MVERTLLNRPGRKDADWGEDVKCLNPFQEVGVHRFLSHFAFGARRLTPPIRLIVSAEPIHRCRLNLTSMHGGSSQKVYEDRAQFNEYWIRAHLNEYTWILMKHV